MNKTIIVTGGAGFIGSNLIRALNARGEKNIIAVDLLRDGRKWQNLLGLEIEDFQDKSAFRRNFRENGLEGVKAVFHLGACSSTTETDADYLADNNYRYTCELCEAALTVGARFVYASSAATYGDGTLSYSDSDEVTPSLRPLNMYGFSKQMFDLWALRHSLLERVVGLKFFNVYGPGEEHKGDMRSMVHKAFGQIRDTGTVSLFRSHLPGWEDGGQKRDFVYVDDAVKVMLYFYDNPGKNGLFNCGTGCARTWLDLMRAVFAAMGIDENIKFVDMPEKLRGAYQYFTEADLAKLRACGYTEEFISIEDGVRDYVQNYLSGS